MEAVHEKPLAHRVTKLRHPDHTFNGNEMKEQKGKKSEKRDRKMKGLSCFKVLTLGDHTRPIVSKN